MSDNIIYTSDTFKKRQGDDPSKGLYFINKIVNKGIEVWYVEFSDSSDDFKQAFIDFYTPEQFYKEFVHSGFHSPHGVYFPVNSEDVKKFLANCFNSDLGLKLIFDLAIEKWKDFDENVTHKEIMITLKIIRRELKAERQAERQALKAERQAERQALKDENRELINGTKNEP